MERIAPSMAKHCFFAAFFVITAVLKIEPVSAQIPEIEKLKFWIRADTGITVNSSGFFWQDQTPGSARSAFQSGLPITRPILLSDAINHLPVVRFYNQNSLLFLNGPPIFPDADTSNYTITLVTR